MPITVYLDDPWTFKSLSDTSGPCYQFEKAYADIKVLVGNASCKFSERHYDRNIPYYSNIQEAVLNGLQWFAILEQTPPFYNTNLSPNPTPTPQVGLNRKSYIWTLSSP